MIFIFLFPLNFKKSGRIIQKIAIKKILIYIYSDKGTGIL